MGVDKEEFLKEFGHDYGYPNGPKSIDEIRATEFKRLDQSGRIMFLLFLLNTLLLLLLLVVFSDYLCFSNSPQKWTCIGKLQV